MILIVGSGGVGQTYFIRFLNNQGITTNKIHDLDEQKHKSHPKYVNKNFTKYIYLFHESGKSIASIFRRSWGKNQIKKLGNPYNLTIESFNNPNEFQNYVVLVETEKKDLFGIEFQFDNFVTSTNKDTLFINFNDVLKYKKELSEFVGKNLNFSKFNIRSRYVYRNISNKYNEVYSELDKKMNKYSGVIVKAKTITELQNIPETDFEITKD